MTNETINIFALSKHDTNVMKGIAIIAMLCHHVYTFQPDWVEAYPTFLTLLGVLGKVCVAMFLFCSGYGLTIQYEKIIGETLSTKSRFRTTILFLLKRFMKFYSAYWFVFLLFVPITVLFFDRPLSAVYGENVNIWKELFLDVLGVQGFRSYNITWWFNRLIIILYLLFPLLFVAIKKTKWVGLLCCLALMRFAGKLDVLNYYSILLWQFPFVLGIGWAIYQEKLIKCSDWVNRHVALAIVIALVLLVIGVLQRLYNIMPFGNITGVRFDGILSVIIVLCIVIILRKLKYIYTILSFLGLHSINVYMIHTFLNGYWVGVHKLLHTSEICRMGGVNMWILLGCCLVISIVLELAKEKLYWNKMTNTLVGILK